MTPFFINSFLYNLVKQLQDFQDISSVEKRSARELCIFTQIFIVSKIEFREMSQGIIMTIELVLYKIDNFQCVKSKRWCMVWALGPHSTFTAEFNIKRIFIN